jgi:hypothetical protein
MVIPERVDALASRPREGRVTPHLPPRGGGSTESESTRLGMRRLSYRRTSDRSARRFGWNSSKRLSLERRATIAAREVTLSFAKIRRK